MLAESIGGDDAQRGHTLIEMNHEVEESLSIGQCCLARRALSSLNQPDVGRGLRMSDERHIGLSHNALGNSRISGFNGHRNAQWSNLSSRPQVSPCEEPVPLSNLAVAVDIGTGKVT